MATAWGIDIGRRAIKGVRLRDSSAGPVLETTDLVEVEVRREASDAERDEATRKALSTFLTRHGIRREPAFVSIPGHTTFNRVLRIPVVDEKRLHSTIRFEAQQQIPFPIEEVVWDYHPLSRTTPSDLEISLYAVKNDYIRKFLHNMELSGLEPAGIQIAPLALFNFARYELDMRGGNIILDMGSDATDMLVLDQDKTWMRTVPMAGNDITKALEDKFHLPFDEAEKLKIKSASSKQAQKIFGVMKPVLTDLVAEIERSLSYYRSQVPNVEFKECLVLGSGGKIVGFRKFLNEALEVEVTRVTSLNRIQIGANLNVEFLQSNLQGLTVALGLALQGLGKADNQVNFLPRPLVEARQARARRPWYAAAAAMLVIALAAGWMGMDTLRAEHDQARKRAGILETFRTLEGDLERLKDDGAEHRWLDAHTRLGQDRLDVARAYGDVLDAFYPAEPEGNRPALWLLSVDVTLDPDASAAAPNRARVSLLGVMENPHEGLVKNLGEDADPAALEEAAAEMRRLCELDVKGLVLDPLQARGCCGVVETSGLQRKGTFVDDLDPDVHKGTRFYRFQIEWRYQKPGK